MESFIEQKNPAKVEHGFNPECAAVIAHSNQSITINGVVGNLYSEQLAVIARQF